MGTYMLRKNDELTRGGGGDPSHLSRLTFSTAPIILFLFHPFSCGKSWSTCCYRMTNAPPPSAGKKNKSSFFTSGPLQRTRSNSLITKYISNNIYFWYKLLRRSILGTAVDWPITVMIISLKPSKFTSKPRERPWRLVLVSRPSNVQATMTTSTLLEHPNNSHWNPCSHTNPQLN